MIENEGRNRNSRCDTIQGQKDDGRFTCTGALFEEHHRLAVGRPHRATGYKDFLSSSAIESLTGKACKHTRIDLNNLKPMLVIGLCRWPKLGA